MTQRTIITRDCTYCPFPASNIVQLCFIASTFPRIGSRALSRAARPAVQGRALPPSPAPGAACPEPRGMSPPPPGGAGGCSGEGFPPQAARELAPQLAAISQNGFRNRVQRAQEEDLDRSVGNQT